ncbi:MAG TPA: excalibur calcium-binding domain-containing protein [Propionibacteriaceae bacterium]
MSLIGGIVAARRHVFTWFGGLALSAKAGIATAAFVTISAGVVIGAPYTPSSAPWLTPTVAPSGTAQTPSPLKPPMVEAATPSDASPSSKPSAKPTGTSGPTGAPTTAAVVETGTRTTTMAQATTTAAAATAPQTTTSVYYTNCVQASKAGVAPITIGQPGYRTELDPNGNGVACESK